MDRMALTKLMVDKGQMAREATEQSTVVSAASLLALALGAAAIGAVAIGVMAIGRLVVGRLVIKKAHFGALEVDELMVRRLHVIETRRVDPVILPTKVVAK
jgi:hypothetical protein